MPNQPLLCPYWENRTHFSIVDDLLLCDERLVIPKSMRPEILKCIHTGHLGISKCRARARASVWWLGLPMQIENMVTVVFLTAANHNVRNAHAVLMKRSYSVVGFRLTERLSGYSAVNTTVTNCSTCAKDRPEPTEPLMSSSFPS